MGEGSEQWAGVDLLREYLQHVERHRVDAEPRLDPPVIVLPESAVIERMRDASPTDVTISITAAGKRGRARLRLV